MKENECESICPSKFDGNGNPIIKSAKELKAEEIIRRDWEREIYKQCDEEDRKEIERKEKEKYG